MSSSAAAAAAASVDLTQNHNVEIISIVSVFSALSTLTLGTRLWAKAVSRRGLGADDIVLVFAWACIMGESGMIAYAINWGLGYHLQALSMPQLINFQKAFFASAFVLPTGLALTKISILLLLHHLFTTPAFRVTVRVLAGIVVAWWLTLILGEVFICQPINSHWDPSVAAHCGNQQAFDYGTPIPWIVTDFAILICPLPVLRQLQVSKPQKYGLMGLFLIGILTCIVSCIRYSTLFYTLTDPTFDVVPAAIWSVVEGNVTVMCASVVASRQALVFLYPRKLVSSIQYRWQSYGSSGSRSAARSHVKLTDHSSNPYVSNPYGIETPLKEMPRVTTTNLSMNSHIATISSNRD